MWTNNERRVTVTLSALATAVVFLAGCGDSSAQGRADAAAAEAEQVSAEARTYAGDPWEVRARAEHLADQHVHDSWEGRIPGHEEDTGCPLAP